MPKSHRAIQQWDHWLTQCLGARVLEAEREHLPSLLTDCYGKHALLIGVPKQSALLKFSAIHHQVLVSPLVNKNNSIRAIEGEFDELPIGSASIDLVLLPHTLEYIPNPRQVLSEACRVVKPEGYIIIFGFNPYSLWGIKKYLTKQQATPWTGDFISAGNIKKWLELADFKMVKRHKMLFRPPIQHHKGLYQKMKFMEWLGSKCWEPWGGVYMLMAQAKHVPFTPIRLHWEQNFSSVKATFTKPSMRNGR